MRTNQVKKYEVGNLCLSTEEMCGAIETYNARTSTTRTPVIFSKDVVAMYPNLQHEGVARTFRVEFLWSDLTIEKVEEVLELGEKTTSKFLTMEQLPTREQEKLLLALVVTRDLGPASPALRVTAPCASLGKARVACTTTVAAPSTGGSASTAWS